MVLRVAARQFQGQQAVFYGGVVQGREVYEAIWARVGLQPVVHPKGERVKEHDPYREVGMDQPGFTQK
jgi:hypothetical protein